MTLSVQLPAKTFSRLVGARLAQTYQCASEHGLFIHQTTSCKKLRRVRISEASPIAGVWAQRPERSGCARGKRVCLVCSSASGFFSNHRKSIFWVCSEFRVAGVK